jgi:cysteine desulfurase
MIYLDHAATSPLQPAAKEAMLAAMEAVGNPSSLHSGGVRAKAVLEESRAAIADCLGCDPKEVLFTSGGTEANALALHGRSRVLTSPMEHPSVLRNCADPLLFSVGKAGIAEILPPYGGVDLVSLQYVNSETGLFQPVEELGGLCRDHGILFHSDGVQGVGKVEIDLHRLPVDLLSFAAHKFGGPVGIGGLYCKADTPLFPLYRGGTPHGGTQSAVLAAGMAAALRRALDHRREKDAYLSRMGETIKEKITRLGGVETGEGKRLPGHLHFRFPNRDGEALAARLDLLGVCVSAGSACHSGSHTPSPTLLAMGFCENEASQGLRITLGEENTPEEMAAFLSLLEGILT